jgi:HEAT repeat protein
MPELQRRLRAMLDLREGEGRPVALLFALAGLLGFARLLFYATANGLFLAAFDSGKLPLVYIAIAAITTGTGLVYSALQKRLPFAWLLRTGVAFLAVSVLLLRAGIGVSSSRWVVFLLPTWFMAMLILGLLVLWGAAGRLFDVRQARRLFGLIGAGEVVGDIVGGLAVSPLAALGGTVNVLFVSAAAFALALVPLFKLDLPTAPVVQTPATRTETKAPYRVFRHRYVLAIALLSALMNISYYFLDLGFLRQVQGHFTDADSSATFIGQLFAITGVVDLFGRVLISGRVLDRFGPTVGVLALPVGLTVAMGAIVVLAITTTGSALFWPVALTMPLWTLLRNWLDKPGSLLLYQPMLPDERTAAQLAVELICDPLSIGVAGVALLLIAKSPTLPAGVLAALSTALAFAWLFVALRLRREYVTVLEEAISKRRLSEDAVAAGGPAQAAIVRRGLGSKHEGEVVYSLSLLASIDPAQVPAVLPGLLSHPSAEVRLHALGMIEKLGLLSAAEKVRERVEWDPIREVQAAALRALAAIGEDDAIDMLRARLSAKDRPMKAAALIGLIGHGGLEGMLVAAPTLQQLTTSTSPQDRVIAADVFTGVAQSSLYRPVLALLEDADPAVQCAALASAGRIANPRLVAAIIPKLGSGKTSAQAAAALVAAGEAAIPGITDALGSAVGRKTRAKAIQVLGRLRSPAASALLWQQLAFPDVGIRQHALAALRRAEVRPDASQQAMLRALLEREIDVAIEDMSALVDLSEDDETLSMLRDALPRALELARARVFAILSFLVHSPRAVRDAQIGLASASAELRANSLEALEHWLTREDARRVVPLVASLSPEEAFERLVPGRSARDAESHLVTQLTRPSSDVTAWSQVTAAWAAGHRKDEALREPITRLAKSSDSWIRETAQWAAEDAETRAARKPSMLTIEKVMILKRTALFSQAPNDVLAEVAGVLERVEVQAGERIITDGERGTSMYIIVDGEVRVHNGDKEVARLKAPTVFGELAALDPQPRLASVTAVTDLLLLRLDNETLETAIAEEPAIARAVIRHLCKTFRGSQTAAAPGRPRSLRETLSGLPADYKMPGGDKAD